MGSKLHRPIFHSSPHGVTFRGCQDCHLTWVLVRGEEQTYWQLIGEEESENRLYLRPRNPLECGGEVTQADRKPASSAASSTSQKGKCFCGECKAKKQHFEGDDDCYCMKCRGKKPHYA